MSDELPEHPGLDRRELFATALGTLLALLATLLASAVALGLSRVLELPNISLILLAAVLVVAVRSASKARLAFAS